MCVLGVVHEQNGRLVVKHGPVKPAEFRLVLRKLYIGIVCPDHVSHGIADAQGLRTDPLQVEIQLRVRVARGELLSEFQRQRSLAHTTQASQA